MNSTDKNQKRNDNHNATIMVVDDIIENLQLLNSMLHANGFKVRSAQSGEQALQSIKSSSFPDLILVDVIMPGMTGFELCRQLKANPETCDIPIIFISLKNDKATIIRGFKIGAVDFIIKPFDVDVALAKINSHLKTLKSQKDLKEKNNHLHHENLAREFSEQITLHDLKSPLNTFFNYPEIIKRRGSLTKKQRKFLGLIEESGHKMLYLINRSTDFYNLEKGHYTYKPEQFDIHSECKNVANEIIQNFQKDEKKIVIINNTSLERDDKLMVQGDKFLNFYMISNLLKNALEAAKKGETIQIILNKSETIDLCIQNQAPVPESIKDQFFDKYVTVGKKKGLGLGTYSAKLSAEAQGAKIEMQSSIDIGTRIIVRFPNNSSY